ncbi:hypothetical protein GEMRC1_007892 [Eukaryota sp. GEM-RC1]
MIFLFLVANLADLLRTGVFNGVFGLCIGLKSKALMVLLKSQSLIHFGVFSGVFAICCCLDLEITGVFNTSKVSLAMEYSILIGNPHETTADPVKYSNLVVDLAFGRSSTKEVVEVNEFSKRL